MVGKADILRTLDAKGISYKIVEHPAVYTIEDLLASDIPNPESIAKNLFVRDDKKKNYYMITVREEKHIDLKQFEEHYGTRRLSFASEADLMNILGLVKGSVTPFGLLNDKNHIVRLFLDRDFENTVLGIHPNDNTATVWLKTSDLLRLLHDTGCEAEWFTDSHS